MINSVSRIMASNYRNSSKENQTSFRGTISRDFQKLRLQKEGRPFDEIAYGPEPGLIKSLVSFLNPFNLLGVSSKRCSGRFTR